MSDNKNAAAVSSTEFEELKALVAAQAAKIEELSTGETGKTVAKTPEKPKTPTATFKVGSKKYKFTVPVIIIPGRGRVNTEDLLKEPATLEELVLKESGVITQA
jgi:hypothetical protein